MQESSTAADVGMLVPTAWFIANQGCCLALAALQCSAQSNIAVMPSGQSSISGEASTVSIPAPHCAYLYSSYRTPTLTGR
jgi:hypothetical protein